MPLSRLRPRTREQALTLWSFVATVLCILTAWIGGGYAVAPNDSKTPTFYVIKELLPGGMRTHGILLLLLSLGMFYVIVTPFDRRTAWVLRLFAFYSFLLAASFVGSWLVTGDIVWGAPPMWLGLGALAQGLVVLPPDSLPEEAVPDAPARHRSRRLRFERHGSQDCSDHRRERGAGRLDSRHVLPTRAHPARSAATSE